MRIVAVGNQLHRVFEAGNGRFGFPLFQLQLAQLVKSLAIIRILPNHFLQKRQRLVFLLRLKQCEGQMIARFGAAGIKLKRRLQLRNGFRRAALVNKDKPDQKVRMRLVGIDSYSFTIFLERRSIDLLVFLIWSA